VSALGTSNAGPASSRTNIGVSGDELFSPNRFLSFKIELTESALAELNRNERAYALAHLSDGKRAYSDVGIHLKGMGSFQPLTQKPSFTVKFDRFVPGQRYLGLKKFMLNNSVQDPTFLAEWLSSQMFRDAGVPAPRVTHAFVEFNGRQLGLYVLVEAVTSDFLTQHFKNGRGSLYEGYLQDIDQPLDQDGGPENGQQDLKKLFEICRIEDPVERWRRLPEVLDVEAYFAQCAVEMFIGHTDGYVMNRNNYRLYHDAATGRFTMIPHGLDWGFANAGAPVHPPTTSIITHAVLGTTEGRRRYDERARQIFTNVFQLTVLSNRVNEATARLKAAARDPTEAQQFESCGAEMLRRIAARHAFIASKLAAGKLGTLGTVGTTTASPSPVAHE
jgi:hypothetical protein